jgi:hypothetical protein
MIGYPTNWLLMVIDDPARAAHAARDVVSLGVAPADVAVLSGEDGTAALRQFGGARGPLGRLVRVVQFMLMDQMPDFVMYEAALREGRTVLAVRPRDREELLAARDAGERNGGHFANWFGRLSTEELSRWRGPEPGIPSHLRR